MTSIDDLFKGHNTSIKRKFENPSELDPTQAFKSAKLNPNSDVKRSSHASVADEEDDEDEAGPSLPPDLEPSDGDDEDGRFFEGGLDENALDAIDYLDAKDAEEAIIDENFDSAWLAKLVKTFEKKVSKNEQLRAKYEDDPSKFMESEGDLDEGIKALSILSEHPELYENFVKAGTAEKLVGLLAHENTDIAIDAIEIISEFTDEDVAAEQAQWDAIVTAMLEADLLSLIVSILGRLNEDEEADRSGVYRSLSVLENLLSQPSNTDVIGKQPKLIDWLLSRIQKSERSTSQNKQYASEILSILTQSSIPNRRIVIAANGFETDGVEILLTQLAPYRKTDPEKDSDEEEYMGNLFNCLTSLLDESEGKVKFLEAEGVELCLLMIRDGRTSKGRALKVLDHACGSAESPPETTDTKTNGTGSKEIETVDLNRSAEICLKFVEVRGLKPLFSTFMKTKKPDPETTEHVLGLFASLLRSLPGDSDARFRVLAKFLEKDFEKINKLVSLRRDYANRVAAFDAKLVDRKDGLSKEELEQFDLENISDRLNEGLYCLERIDAILAWLVAEDDGAKKAIIKALAERDEGLDAVRKTLEAQLNGVLEVDAGERDMLETLIGFLS